MKKPLLITTFSVVMLSLQLSGCTSQPARKVPTVEPGSMSKPDRVVPVASKIQKQPDVAATPAIDKKDKQDKKKTNRGRGASKPEAVRLPQRHVQRPYRANGYAARLTGDFASNPQTLAFIEQMVRRHGFDRRYLNYIFSNTRATPFLQKMAYRDAFPVKKNRKSRKGNWTRYRNLFLTEDTIRRGVQFWRQNRVALQRAEQRYGVPQEYILGIIGVETRYGGNVGKNRAIDALATMGFNNPRRGRYFQKELESFLLMTRRTGMNPLQPMSSYAGALGLCQFMPSNIKRYGVDHDSNGVCNLWHPADAIGSVANYLRQHGWRPGTPVAVLASTQGSKHRNFKSSYKKTHSLSTMQRHGIYPLEPIGQKVRLLRMSTYNGDEVWLAGYNFYVITRYNHSSKYAMAVHQLAQAIRQRIKPGTIRMASAR